jgi:hypothetical protein
MELTPDLKAPAGKPVLLFKASQPGWAVGYEEDAFITDGPFMYKNREGRLVMLWASMRGKTYCEAISYSTDGALLGKWEHDEQLLFDKDGGHGMLFRSNEGVLKFICHQPNETPKERPVMIDISEEVLDGLKA